MSTHPSTLRQAAIVAARFGQNYGYRFDGDIVTLHASIQLTHYLAHEARWFLQLQASPVTGSAATKPFAHIIAEAPLPPLAELTGSVDAFSLSALAQPPAGQGEFNIGLALVSRQVDQQDELHDFAVFSRTETFLQPRIAGTPACEFADSSVTVRAPRIENPRDTANMSGTLSLELWALTEPYAGGAFDGQPLAGVILGQLPGQAGWDDLSHTLHCAKPMSGKWRVALMLREWTGSGYTTRDFSNLAEPLVIGSPVAAKVSAEAAPAPEKPAPKPTTAAKPAKNAAKKPAASTTRKPKAGK